MIDWGGRDEHGQGFSEVEVKSSTCGAFLIDTMCRALAVNICEYR